MKNNLGINVQKRANLYSPATKRQDSWSTAEASSRRTRRLASRTKHPLVNRNLPPLPFPAEIWVQIIEEYPGRKEWLALTKTCWFFYRIAQPRLYEKVHLCGGTHFRDVLPTVWDHPCHPLALFEISFYGRPELGTFIRDLAFEGEFIVRRWLNQRGGPSFIPHLLSNLDQFPNLGTLRLKTCRIGSNLLYAIHFHPHLSVGEFSSCTLDGSLAHPHFHDISQSPISDVKILLPSGHFDTVALWATLICARLQSLELVTDSLQPLCPDRILSSIMMSGRNHWLETLTIDTVSGSFIPFLVSSPRLRNLFIRSKPDTNSRIIFSSLPEAAIPLLEHYNGPSELSGFILRKRPIHSVVLGFDYDTGITADTYVDVLGSLQLPSVPVTELELWTTGVGIDWLLHVPITICHLIFHCEESGNMDEGDFIQWFPAICTALLCLKNLHTVSCIGYKQTTGKLVLGQQDIMQISENCPSLREFDLEDQRWVMVKPSIWECFQKQAEAMY